MLHRPSYGAFGDPPPETILKHPGRDTVIICGTLTNFCGKTARQADGRGFQAVFGADGADADDPAMQQPELRGLRKGFARVLAPEQILAALTAPGGR